MSDEALPPPRREDGGTYALIAYILGICSFGVAPAAFLAVALAYAKRSGASPVVAGHFAFLIRTFWLALAALAAAAALVHATVPNAGWLVYFGYGVATASSIWTICRLVSGVLKLNDRSAVTRPDGWGFFA